MTLQVDELTLEWTASPRRKHAEIVVDRDGSLKVSSPATATESEVEEFVRGKKLWVHTKLAIKASLAAPAPRPQFLSGEGFLYLGRSHRLKLVPTPRQNLGLERGHFVLDATQVDRAREHFIAWYTRQGRRALPLRARRYLNLLGVEAQGIKVQDLGYRWGSCGTDRVLYFHWRAMMLPVAVLDYLVAHEATHLVEPNHTERFWSLLATLMPEYDRHKRWLAEHGAEVDL